MKLQLAFDTLTMPQALAMASEMRGSVDRFELGTPFLLEYGMEAVRQFRTHFPEKEILADTKIMDAGKLEAESAFRAGADFVTVLALADTDTIRSCVEAANACGGKVIADLICVHALAEKTYQLEKLGVHGIAVHTGVDQQKQGRTPLTDLCELRMHSRRAEISVAGGISRLTAADYCAQNPDVLIIGGGILNTDDPVKEATAISDMLHAFKKSLTK